MSHYNGHPLKVYLYVFFFYRITFFPLLLNYAMHCVCYQLITSYNEDGYDIFTGPVLGMRRNWVCACRWTRRSGSSNCKLLWFFAAGINFPCGLFSIRRCGLLQKDCFRLTEWWDYGWGYIMVMLLYIILLYCQERKCMIFSFWL